MKSTAQNCSACGACDLVGPASLRDYLSQAVGWAFEPVLRPIAYFTAEGKRTIGFTLAFFVLLMYPLFMLCSLVVLLPNFIGSIVIGHCVYAFLGDDDVLHVHNLDPRDKEYRALRSCAGSWPQYLERYAILELRLGGLLRKNRIHGKGSGDWRILSGWEGTDIVLADYAGNVVADLARGEDPVVDCLLLVSRYGLLAEVWRECRMRQNLTVVSLEKEVLALRGQRDAVGVGVSGIISAMAESQDSKSRPPLKHWRLRLEELLGSISKELSVSWQGESWRKRLQTRRRPPPT